MVLLAVMEEERLILVVEDDDATRAFRLDNLAADGFRVVGAGGAGEGLRAIEVRQPALVVLDLMLADGSGLTLLDRVRTADGLASRLDPELPVIVLSGRAGDADRVRSFARGADDHLNKPTCRFPQCEEAGSTEPRPGRRLLPSTSSSGLSLRYCTSSIAEASGTAIQALATIEKRGRRRQIAAGPAILATDLATACCRPGRCALSPDQHVEAASPPRAALPPSLSSPSRRRALRRIR